MEPIARVKNSIRIYFVAWFRRILDGREIQKYIFQVKLDYNYEAKEQRLFRLVFAQKLTLSKDYMDSFHPVLIPVNPVNAPYQRSVDL